MVYAGFWKRFAALLLDGLFVWILNLILILIPIIGVVISLVFSFFYSWIFLSSPLKSTPGRMILGIKLVKENGDNLSFIDIILRNLASILSGLFLFIGYFLNLFTQKRQTLHDLLVKTVVVEEEYNWPESSEIFKGYVQKLLSKN